MRTIFLIMAVLIPAGAACLVSCEENGDSNDTDKSSKDDNGNKTDASSGDEDASSGDTDIDTDTDTDTDSDSDGGPQMPILDSDDHEGWQAHHCDDCHDLPLPYHHSEESWECAGCHGGNGSCDPNQSTREHTLSESCMDCHEGHGYTENVHCSTCHFAYTGLVDCTP